MGAVAGLGAQAGRFPGGSDGQSGADQRVAAGDVWRDLGAARERVRRGTAWLSLFFLFCLAVCLPPRRRGCEWGVGWSGPTACGGLWEQGRVVWAWVVSWFWLDGQ